MLRLKAGDACEVVAGAAVYAASVSSAKAPVRVALACSACKGRRQARSTAHRWGLVQALTRPQLLDQVLEKGTEVGASFFVVVPAAESTTPAGTGARRRLERWRRIVLEAAKQSKQTTVPVSRVACLRSRPPPTAWKRAGVSVVLGAVGAPALLGEGLDRAPDRLRPQASPDERSEAALALWIGPESGWSRRSCSQFADAGIGRRDWARACSERRRQGRWRWP